jgi:hypothetical protein
MAKTYEPISTQTASGSASTITFSSIPATYTDLVLVANIAAASGSFGSLIQFNSDTTTNYGQTVLYGDGASAASVRSASGSSINLNYYGDATTVALAQTIIINIMNYANTTTYKTFISRAGNADGTYAGLSAIVGLWKKAPEAINSITIKTVSGGNYSSTSTFTLYGIKAAV